MKFKVTGIIAETGEIFVDDYICDNDYLTVKELVKLLAIDGVVVLRMDEITDNVYKHNYTADYFMSWENFYNVVKTFGDSGKKYNDGITCYIKFESYGDTIYKYSPSNKEFYSVYYSIGD
jgi:hypothetical protein